MKLKATLRSGLDHLVRTTKDRVGAAPLDAGIKKGQPFRITQPQLREAAVKIGRFLLKSSTF